jgi:hypothetical protein
MDRTHQKWRTAHGLFASALHLTYQHLKTQHAPAIAGAQDAARRVRRLVMLWLVALLHVYTMVHNNMFYIRTENVSSPAYTEMSLDSFP